ncbi:conserved hypothetical protein [Uncinocarpus reesii 1704]|uniref:Uncharacterized protein n=1 Tax=Uncinocarpus reesii (strain UAMH 1704) TaxID=336963 RepID=C4JXZ6_UNCRE|nr:uncharacterized protein UREG_07047 [Uncinocarpus reesii 1704]EEP82182.1 conserved hypothetical protein [Uncinocarpus reesii 1704]
MARVDTRPQAKKGSSATEAHTLAQLEASTALMAQATGDERVIAAGQQDEGDHVEHSQIAGAAAQLSDESGLVVDAVVEQAAVGQLAADVEGQQQGVEARGQGADIDGGGQLELAVMSLAAEGGV